MSDKEPVRLTLKIKTEDVILEDPENNTETLCEVCELVGDERDKYLESQKHRTTGNRVTNFKGVMTDLIVITLRKKDSREYFKKSEIEKFPSTVQTYLYETASRLSAFTKDEKKALEDEAGNS